MKKLILIVLLPFMSLAANPRDSYRVCLSASNKHESPADRDAEKIKCFYQGRAKSIDLCFNLARVLEHTSSSDSLILDCISNNIMKMKVDACLEAAKKLYYSENRDKAIWSCIETHPIKKSRCKSVSGDVTYTHTKNIVYNYCIMKN